MCFWLCFTPTSHVCAHAVTSRMWLQVPLLLHCAFVAPHQSDARSFSSSITHACATKDPMLPTECLSKHSLEKLQAPATANGIQNSAAVNTVQHKELPTVPTGPAALVSRALKSLAPCTSQASVFRLSPFFFTVSNAFARVASICTFRASEVCFFRLPWICNRCIASDDVPFTASSFAR